MVVTLSVYGTGIQTLMQNTSDRRWCSVGCGTGDSEVVYSEYVKCCRESEDSSKSMQGP